MLSRGGWDAAWGRLYDAYGEESAAGLLCTLFRVQDAGGAGSTPGQGSPADDDYEPAPAAAAAASALFASPAGSRDVAPPPFTPLSPPSGRRGGIYGDFTDRGDAAGEEDDGGAVTAAPHPLATPFTILRPSDLRTPPPPPPPQPRLFSPAAGGSVVNDSPDGNASATSATLEVTRFRFHMLGRSEWLTNDAAVALCGSIPTRFLRSNPPLTPL